MKPMPKLCVFLADCPLTTLLRYGKKYILIWHLVRYFKGKIYKETLTASTVFRIVNKLYYFITLYWKAINRGLNLTPGEVGCTIYSFICLSAGAIEW